MGIRQKLTIKGAEYYEDDPTLQAALSMIYNTADRPMCMCVPGGVEMYVARYADYVIKRLPDTGSKHHPTCAAFEIDATESGRGELLGKAITEHAANEWEIRVKFPLARTPGRSVQRGTPGTATEVTSRSKSASMLALLHEMWERTGFNKWYPAMEGKRNWGTVRTHLMAEASRARTKNQLLSDVLLTAEPFNKDKAQQQADGRRKVLASLQSPKGDVQHRMLIVVGELKQVEGTTMGVRLRLKHMPELAFILDADTWKRAATTYATQLKVHEADDTTRLVVAALIFSPVDQIYEINQITLMLTTQHWIPIEDANDNALIRRLTADRRRFIRPLRFDSKHWGSFANAKLLDIDTAPVNLHILSGTMAPEQRAAKESAIAESPQGWVWRVEQSMPDLPAPSKEPQ